MKDLRFDLARVTIEASAPLAIGTGAGNDLEDSIFVTDADGLPAIPGSSIAGSLRHALACEGDPDKDERCKNLFGYQMRDEGSPSRVEVSWAHVHGPDDRPVRFRGQDLSHGEEERQFFALLASGASRDHVRLDVRGTADERGKFDETFVPRGARFTFELVVRDPREGELDTLLGLLAAPGFRLGGRTRRGRGSFRIVRVCSRAFDLARTEDRQAHAALPVPLHEASRPGILAERSTSATFLAGRVSARLHLQPEDYWMFGRGEPLETPGAEKEADMNPVRERSIVWRGDRGAFRTSYIVPATGVKGALRHRVAFHARRLACEWAEEMEKLPEKEPQACLDLFGEIRGEDSGLPGKVFLSDLYLSEKLISGPIDHVSIDRFSGGPVDGKLFREQPLYRGGPFTLELVVDRRRLSDASRLALSAALADLCEGRLALGGGASRGHGYFEGRIDWEDKGAWIQGEVRA